MRIFGWRNDEVRRSRWQEILPIQSGKTICLTTPFCYWALFTTELHSSWTEQLDLLFYRAWLLIAHCCLYKKVTRQQIYGMPTGSVIVWLDNLLSLGHLKARFHDTRLLADFGLSYPRIFFISGANIMLFLELCKILIGFLKKWYRKCYLFLYFCSVFRMRHDILLLNSPNESANSKKEKSENKHTLVLRP